jgi:hypothetical protein
MLDLPRWNGRIQNVFMFADQIQMRKNTLRTGSFYSAKQIVSGRAACSVVVQPADGYFYSLARSLSLSLFFVFSMFCTVFQN